jgi:hypothetical protein
MSSENKSQNITKTGFYFKNNSKLGKKLFGLNLFFLIFFLFIGINGAYNNPFIAIYTCAKWVNVINLNSLMILSLFETKTIPAFIEDSKFQKKILTRRINFIYLVSIGFFIVYSIIALLNYYLHIPEYLNARTTHPTIILYYTPSLSDSLIMITIGLISLLTAYFGNYFMARFSFMIEKNQTSGRFFFNKKHFIYHALGINLSGGLLYYCSAKFARNINANYFLIIDGLIISVLCFIFWRLGYHPLKSKNFEFPEGIDTISPVRVNRVF